MGKTHSISNLSVNYLYRKEIDANWYSDGISTSKSYSSHITSDIIAACYYYIESGNIQNILKALKTAKSSHLKYNSYRVVSDEETYSESLNSFLKINIAFSENKKEVTLRCHVRNLDDDAKKFEKKFCISHNSPKVPDKYLSLFLDIKKIEDEYKKL